MEKKIGYKVIRKYNGCYVSSARPLGFGFGGVIYWMNKEIRPIENCGPLSLFRTLESAFKYIENIFPFELHHEYEVLRSEYIESDETVIYDRKDHIKLNTIAISSFMTGIPYKDIVLASMIKPLKLIEWGKVYA
jgi:hypothetical protein